MRDLALNGDLGFIQEGRQIPVRNFSSERRIAMLLGKLLSGQSNSLGIKVIERCPLDKLCRPITDIDGLMQDCL
ncbi:hypothetical protein D3C85_1702610 [compost metagenome]